ncbi:MAG TPA: TIM-barrel domain-containing protein [Candidatus Aquilonibacter sp.]|nr:TIM-barrel domain-containing protein [Candidatus Aquilonibacter sp.]
MFARDTNVVKTLAALVVLCGVARAAPPSVQSDPSQGCGIGPAQRFEALPSGVRLIAAHGVEEIDVLRPDILRVRIAAAPQLPEDASWAVVPEAHRAKSPAKVDSNAATITVTTTSSVSALLNRNNLDLTVRDSSGRVILEDARPSCFRGESFRVSERMPHDEHYFALGDKTGPLDRRGEAFDLWNTDSYRFQESTDPLYKSIPFFMTFRAGEAAGIFLDDTWRSSFDFGKDLPDVYSFGAVAGPLDYYIFAGPTPRDVVEQYTWLTGRPPLPPLWMLGYQQSRYTYAPEQKLMDVATRLRADKIPADAVYLDIGFQEKNRPFTVDTTAFPDFAGMVKRLGQMNFKLVVITDLHIAKLPNAGYAPYDSGMAQDQFVHNPDGSVFTGIVWPGPSVFPDFTRTVSRDWWGTLYTQFVHDGVAGFWNDMNEPSVFNTPNKTMPLDVVHRIDSDDFAPRTATHAEIHNVYGMENSRATFDGLRKLLPDERPFVLTRATFAGGQRYAATWTGDDSSTWNHLRMTAPMLKNLGLSGFSFSGADVGGFAGTPPTDLLTRWLEIGAFQPIDRDHTEAGTAPQEPWVGGAEQEDIRRRFIEERYRLMPYLYTLADESARTGLPMMRPVFLDYPKAASDGHPIDIDPSTGDEFLLGHDLLIAPSPYPEESDGYVVEFPTADWYDYWTGKRVPASPPAKPMIQGVPLSGADLVPLTAFVLPQLSTLPVYVRAGAILPIAPLVQSTSQVPQGPLTLRVYAGPDCHGSLYLDDGHTYAYQHGDFLRMNFGCEINDDGLSVTVSRQGSYQPWWKTIRLEIYGWQPRNNRATVEGQTNTITVQHSGEASVLSLPYDGRGFNVRVQ